MSRRRHRKKNKKGVELNLAAMLDMAFQLLTFFILTFRPAPIEGHLSVNMPPPIPQTNVESRVTVGDEGAGGVIPALHALHMYVTATEGGDVEQVRLESSILANGPLSEGALAGIAKRLRPVFGEHNVLYDRIQIEVGRNLRYEELLKLVDVCSQQKQADGSPIGKVSFVEMQR